MIPYRLIFFVCLAWAASAAAYVCGMAVEAERLQAERAASFFISQPVEIYKTEYRSEQIFGRSDAPVRTENGRVMLDQIYGCGGRDTEARHVVKIDPMMRRDKIDWTRVESFEVHYEQWNATSGERIESTYDSQPVRFEAPPNLAFERSQEIFAFVGEKVRVWWSPGAGKSTSRPIPDRLYDIELVSVTLKADY